MFQDADEELKRLEAELLRQEEAEKPQEPEAPEVPEELEEVEDWEALEKEDAPVVYSNYANRYGRELRNYASGYRAYNADRTDTDPEALSDAVQEPEKGGAVRGLIILAIVLLVAIAAVLGWLFWRLGGMS